MFKAHFPQIDKVSPITHTLLVHLLHHQTTIAIHTDERLTEVS